MASPRVFISSTCYDLADERDGLDEFCATFGFDTTLSERGDVFYHPDLHTHLSCVRETSNCHLFVLIIGGRFGGKYKVDPDKSITNAEYSAAIQNGTPSFCFVKQDVLNDHNVWQRNKHLPFSKEIQYPSIEKQEHAEEIFKFIDAVRLAPTNNGIFGFRLAKDIHEMLKKQWAGMMFEYLQSRAISKQLTVTNDALGNLAVVSSKIEELVKHIVRNVDAAGAADAIQGIDAESAAAEFLSSVSLILSDKKFISEQRYEKYKDSLPDSWSSFLAQCGWAKIGTERLPDGTEQKSLHDLVNSPVLTLSGGLSKKDEIKIQTLETGYAKLLELSEEQRDRILSKYIWTREEAAAAAAAAASVAAAAELRKNAINTQPRAGKEKPTK